MHHGSFGLMVHYIVNPEGCDDAEKTDSLNRIVDNFNLDGFISQFLSTGADWLIFTYGQNTGYYCSPNPFLDGLLPGHTSRRDLVGEIGRRLEAHGKWFIAYLPAAVENSESVQEVFGWRNEDRSVFQKNYTRFIRNYSLSLGTRLHGWWFDGCWIETERFGDWKQWMDASRAGNPERIVAVSPGPSETPMTPMQDYLAGETYELPPPAMPASRFTDGVQWHALLPVYSNFVGGPPCIYDDKILFDWVGQCKSVGGAVTINLPVTQDGRILRDGLDQLCRLHEKIKQL